jgi:DNA-binding NarL/FixJ family response regulator
MISIIVADTHAIVRRGLREILDERTGMVVRGEAQTGEEVLVAIEKQNFNVLLLDVNMPDRDGIELLQQVREMKPELPVIMLSGAFHCDLAIKAIKGGAAGYLTSGTPPEELVKAIHIVSRGERYITPQLADCMASALQNGGNHDGTPHDQLSEREYQVLCMLGSGLAVKEIAYELGLSDKTVSTYRARVVEKLGLQSNVDLIRYTIRYGLAKVE